MARLARVAVTGGTHGNEPNGVELARHLQRHPELAARGSFDTTVLITNPAAVAKSVRYVEEDLNRCFLQKDLADDGRSSLEAVRARELNAILGPKGTPDATDYIIDLHNTTANTGVALMISPTDELSHGLAAYLIALDSDVRVCNWAKGASDYALLPTLGKHGMTFEVGPCPTGCVIGESYARSLTLIGAALDYLHAYNLSISPAPGVAPPSHVDDRVCVYVFVAKVRPPRLTSREWCHVSHPRLRPLPSRHVAATCAQVPFPRDESGDLAAMIHPRLDGSDFTPLTRGDPIFQTHDLRPVRAGHPRGNGLGCAVVHGTAAPPTRDDHDGCRWSSPTSTAPRLFLRAARSTPTSSMSPRTTRRTSRSISARGRCAACAGWPWTRRPRRHRWTRSVTRHRACRYYASDQYRSSMYIAVARAYC